MYIGYEGGSSDTDEDSVSVVGPTSSSGQCSPYWVIVQVLADKVLIFFQTR